MAKRKLINWDYIEPLYRIGALSNYEIAAQYSEIHKDSETWKQSITESVIRKQARLKGWKKNLADRVKIQVRENLVRGKGAHAYKTDSEIIHQAAETGSNVVLRHREEISALIEHENRLLDELGDEPTKVHVSSYQGEVIETVLGLTVREKAETLKALSAVRAQRISLEREAYNLDDPETDEDKIMKRTRIVRRKTRDMEE
ncbi:hypothetical protein [Desulfobacter postgatei]|uniref:hypothetical protein n=1 Tax=Desulfobacter postgatei TaxID=2293 RepID=UPI00259B3F6E|nr:hypothetical protein [uncultured Desulfobacter sp.]